MLHLLSRGGHLLLIKSAVAVQLSKSKLRAIRNLLKTGDKPQTDPFPQGEKRQIGQIWQF
jgi:hypothetical protein